MKFEIISRADAHAQGRKRFYTGKPCKYGHDSQRFVTTGGCVACNAARARAFTDKGAGRSGMFSYPLHPEDFAAAHAYCQALDMQRGKTPQPLLSDTSAPLVGMTVEEAEVARARIFADKLAPAEKLPHVPAEMRQYGVAK